MIKGERIGAKINLQLLGGTGTRSARKARVSLPSARSGARRGHSHEQRTDRGGFVRTRVVQRGQILREGDAAIVFNARNVLEALVAVELAGKRRSHAHNHFEAWGRQTLTHTAVSTHGRRTLARDSGQPQQCDWTGFVRRVVIGVIQAVL